MEVAIGVVDYGMGNLHSVAKAVLAAGGRAQRIDGPGGLERVRAIVLPGVGTFADAMAALTARALVEPLRQHLAADRPFLGICLGLQLLFESGDEGGVVTEGLGALRGTVARLAAESLAVPHIGWNSVDLVRRADPLFAGIPDGAHFYYLHSFVARPEDREVELATTSYPTPFCAAVGRGAAYATQFHPEKSQALGLRVLRNFIGLARSG